MNTQRGVLSRLVMGVLIWMLVFVCTLKSALAGHVFKTLFHKQDTMSAFRRAVWFLRHSWLGIKVIDDPFYDFAQDFTPKEVQKCDAFFAPRLARDPSLENQSDQLLIMAKRVEHAIINGNATPLVHRFSQVADGILSAMNLEDFAPLSAPKKSPNRDGDFDVDGAIDALRDFHALGATIDLKWFVMSGTFLGLVRENAFLPHDFDIDLGLMDGEYDMAGLLRAIGASDAFHMRKLDIQKTMHFAPNTAHLEEHPTIIKLVHKNGISIDLFFHYITGATVWHGSSFQLWENTTFDLAPYDFYGLSVMGPTDSDRYLSENYGDWRTPRTDFNATADTPNLSIVNNLSSLALVIKTLVRNYQSSDPHCLKILGLLQSSGFVDEQVKFIPLGQRK